MKCKNCGEKVVKFPIKDSNGNIIWKNLFKMDLMSIILIVVVISMVTGFKQDIKKCEDAIERPCEFCETTGCCQVDWEYISGERARGMTNINLNIPDINMTGNG